MQVEGVRVEEMKRFAAPVAVVVMVWVVLWMLYQVGLFLLVDGTGPFANAGWSPFGAWEAFVLSVVVSVTVLWARPRQAAELVLAAVVIAVIGVLLQIASLVVSTVNLFNGLGEPEFALLEVLRMVVNLVLPVLALVWLLRLRGVLSGVAGQPALPQHTGPAPAWRPEQARGAHWPTASGAATGSAASDWGTPGQRGGWGPPTHAMGAGAAGTHDSAPQTPTPPDGGAHQPRGPQQFGPQQFGPQQFGPQQFGPQQFGPQQFGPQQFGPQGLAEQYGRRDEGDAEQTRSVPSGRREPPQWIPLDRSGDEPPPPQRH